jgi:hypothetical protein
MLDAMGLKESVHIFDKLRVLRAEGAKDLLLREIGVPGERDRYLASAKFHKLTSSLPSLLTSGSIVDERLISHLMIPLDPGRRTFLQSGLKGGHDDGLLHEFINSHPKYVIVKEAEKVAKGVTYRKYSPYRWQGSGPKPTPHDPRFPFQSQVRRLLASTILTGRSRKKRVRHGQKRLFHTYRTFC